MHPALALLMILAAIHVLKKLAKAEAAEAGVPALLVAVALAFI